uniref:Reverse transcriptase domain-containing protein n=1 Tax=Rhabditophanes sp. KR3021 TaxID=114890 RepID=A0AC35TYB9_9BILA
MISDIIDAREAKDAEASAKSDNYDQKEGKGPGLEKAKAVEINKKNCFQMDSLLAKVKVPRGRRPNTMYPRVQACKNMTPYYLQGFLINQPAGKMIKPE